MLLLERNYCIEGLRLCPKGKKRPAVNLVYSTAVFPFQNEHNHFQKIALRAEYSQGGEF